MAYMDQSQKQEIAAELKKVMPAGWKWSLSVKNYSTIALTISQGPKELTQCLRDGEDYRQVNEHYLDREFSGKTLSTMKKIKSALNLNTFDHSDSQSDYFHVGHYVNINIGKWDKPYIVK